MVNANYPVLALRGTDSKGKGSVPIKVKPTIKKAAPPKKDNARSRRLAKQMVFWDSKRAEHEAKPKSRSVDKIVDSVVRVVDENDIYARLIVGLKKDMRSDNNSGSCCMSDVALYSTKTKTRRRLESGGVTARV
ncbi:hypothetical protein [Xenorhabdus anantnagensis]|uniref:Uncharacterized protein n=1 Tax=Xenorhabdus anantnagensis TaxID=3025875 RepID=A0ABT5LX53_9GAMM|nr:hypothetical protein [Xenorhabdus anantnagensis]MDC9599032.1 hypothetical protein [Xenorhabdus anantnagensis]